MSNNANSDQSAAMGRAADLLRAGQTVEAEEVMLEEVRRAQKAHGRGTPGYASALNELAVVLMNVRQFERAIAALDEATAGPDPADPVALRDRLTYLMNLGMLQRLAGRPADAERTLRRGLAGRLAHYGREHAGYAFGLEPLGEVLLELGRAPEALDAFAECVGVFWANGHPRVATALALRAEAMKAAGDAAPPLDGLDALPGELIAGLAEKAIGRVGEGNLLHNRAVLADVDRLVAARLGSHHPVAIDVLVARSNVERMLEEQGQADHELRVGVLERAIGAFDQAGRPGDAVNGFMGLAVALAAAGRLDDADAAHQEADRRARALGDPALVSQNQRNWGLFLAERKLPERAETQLRRAVDSAQASRDAEMLGRAQVALGIFLQHQQRFADARPLLAQAVRTLDPDHPDAICGRGHLGALDTNRPCGCGDTREAIAEAFREFAMARLPSGLLERLDVTLKDNDFQLGVHVVREPTEAEVEQMNRVLTHALEEFRQRLRRNR